MKKLPAVLSIVVLLLSCSKDKVGANAGEVYVRLENATGFTLENAHVSNIMYGNVTPDKITSYQVVNTAIYTGFCGFTTNGIEMNAGYAICGTPMPSAFEPGYYTFKVEPAVSGFNGITVTKQ